MTSHTHKPISDEKLQLISGQVVVGQAILVAHELGLFKLLAQRTLSIGDISCALNIQERAAQALVSCGAAMGFIESVSGQYGLSVMGRHYLDEASGGCYGHVLDFFIEENALLSYDNVKRAIVSNRGRELFLGSEQLSSTEKFVRALHCKAFRPAMYWPRVVDLSMYRHFIDVGGGSGIHTIGACMHHRNLKGWVCERERVAEWSRGYVREFALEDRITLVPMNMWLDQFPEGDVVFFGDIFHDWPADQCSFLARKAFDALRPGGMIVLHEMLFDEAKTGPLLTAAYNMKMVLWTEGHQWSGGEIVSLLEEVGFEQVEIRQGLGNWSLVTGIKL